MRHARLSGALAAGSIVVVLVGCGESHGSKIEKAARQAYGASSATCSSAGLALVVGTRTTVYRCTISPVDVAHRPVKDIGTPTLHRCFVEVGGTISDVTERLGRAAAVGVAQPFPCH